MKNRQQWHKLGVIFPCTGDGTWDEDPSAPFVMRVGDRLRMYYHGRNGRILQVGMAEASPEKPLQWKKTAKEPIISIGPAGAIDSCWVAYPWVVPITETHWHMYYAAWAGEFHDHLDQFKKWRTAMAESDDGGLTWRRDGRPLIEIGRPFTPDEHGSGSCAVLKVGDEYWMWYTALSHPTNEWRRISTALAVSRDGGHTFTPHPAGSLIGVDPTFENPRTTCSKPFVRRVGDGYQMWFSHAADGQHYRVHYAESRDGVYFTWDPTPAVDVSPNDWDSEMTCYPSVIDTAGGTYMFYDGNSYAGIGAAQLTT